MRLFRFILLSLLLLTASLARASSQFPSDWYWVVADTTASTTVFQSSSGTYISNIDAAYTTWMAAQVGTPQMRAVSNAVDNGSGLVRLTVSTTDGMITGQYYTVVDVAGATGANGAWAVTIIDNTTVDLQGTTFGGAYTSGGYIGSGYQIATAAQLYALLAGFSQTNGFAIASSTISSSVSVTLTAPVAVYTDVTFSAASKTIRLPVARLTNSMALGREYKWCNQGAYDFSFLDGDGSALSGIVTPGNCISIVPKTNTATAGTYTLNISPFSSVSTAFPFSVSPGGDGALLLGTATSGGSFYWLQTAMSGDATIAGGSGALTIANSAVSGGKIAANTVANSNLATMANSTVKCRTTAGTGSPEDCTGANVAGIMMQSLYASAVIDFNTTNTDHLVTVTCPTGYTKFQLASIRTFNTGATASLTTATYGVWTGAAEAGTAVVTSGAVLSAITTNAVATNAAMTASTLAVGGTAYFTCGTNFYYRMKTAQGAAASGTAVFQLIPFP